MAIPVIPTPGGSLPSLGTTPPFILPDANTLENEWGFSQKAAQAFAGKELRAGKSSVTSAATLQEAILGLPSKFLGTAENLSQIVFNHFNIPAPGSPGFSTALQDAFRGGVAAGGTLGNINPTAIYDPTQAVFNNKQAALTNASATSQASAYNAVVNYLDQWGLSSLAPMVISQITAAGDHVVNTNALLDQIRSTPQYKNAFPGLTERNSSLGPGAEHMTEQQYQNFVAQIQGTAGQYGLPQGFVTKDEIANLVKNNVSASEFDQRVQRGYLAASNADAATKQILQREYGIDQGHLAAYFLDPTKALPVLERQTASAAIQGYAQNVGLSGVGQAGGEQLANMVNLGTGSGMTDVNMSNIKNALLTASRDVNLTGAAPGAQAPTVDTRTLIGSQIAGYGGTNQVEAQTAVQRAEQGRAAPFEKGGGYAETSKGVVGLGSARQ
jgi:hypothetical protein